MRAVRRINNNVAVCEDDAGNELLAMGKGIGFGKLPRDLPLSEVERTFYDVDPAYLTAVNDLPAEILEFAAKASVSVNLFFTSFAKQARRSRKGGFTGCANVFSPIPVTA